MFIPICAPILHQGEHYIQIERNKPPLDPRHLGVPSSAPKMISEPIAFSAQTVQLSCVLIHIISKETEMSFHLTRHLGVPLGATKNISMPMVHPAQTCTYLALRLTLSSNGPK
jgi:hypothetical protein